MADQVAPSFKSIPNRINASVHVAPLILMLACAPMAHAQLGVPISAPSPVNTNAAGDTTTQDAIPDLATDGQGTWIAVWQLTGSPTWPNGTDPDIYFARSTNYGLNWSAPAPLNLNAADDDHDDLAPHIFTDGNGHWLCAWTSTFPLNGSAGDRDILVSRSLDAGQTWLPAIALNSNAIEDIGADFDIDIVFDGTGTWIAAWRTVDTLNNSIGNDGDILFSRSSDHGTSWSPPAALNTNASDDHGLDQKPRLATNGLGNWIAVWQSTESFAIQPADNDIFFTRSIDNGMSWLPPARLNSNAAADNKPDLDPRIVTDAAGQWIVTWSSTNNVSGNGIDGDIMLARSADNGQSWTSAAALNANAGADAGADVTPTLDFDGAGRWVCTWTSNDSLDGTNDGDNDILVARSVNGGVTWSVPVALNTNAGDDLGTDDFPRAACDLDGGVMIAWESRDSLENSIGTDRDVLFARFALPDCNNNTMPDRQETDCNRNSIPDSCDIAAATSLDVNGNLIPDECEKPGEPCPADCHLPHNNTVDIDDLVTVIINWASTAPNNPADVTGNGIVNIDDLVQVVINWGPCD